MTWADLIAAIATSGLDLSREASIRLDDNANTVVKSFDRSIFGGKGWLTPAAPLYTQTDMDAARDEAYEQGVADAKDEAARLEPVGAGEGGGR
jgi:hypothetical protein